MFGLALCPDQLELRHFKTDSAWSKAHIYGFSAFIDYFRAKLGPCLALLYFQTRCSSEIFKTESILSKDHVYGLFTFWEHVRAIFGPCLDHVWPSVTNRPAKVLKLSRLSQYCLSHISMKFVLFEPGHSHNWTIIALC